jgi:AcrR family transcriptional regulator
MAHVVAEDAGSATVSRVVSRAGVSRRTFYEQFSGCEDCFLAVFEDAVERAIALATAAAVSAPSAGWREQVRAGLAALLGFFDEEPAVGSLLVVDALGAGPGVLERRARVLDVLTAVVDRGRSERSEARGGRASVASPPPLTAEGVVGAVLSVIHARISSSGWGVASRSIGREGARLRALHASDRGRGPIVRDRPAPPIAALSGLLNPLMAIIVLPYLGQAAAAKELARPAPKVSRGPRSSRAPHGASGDPLAGLNMRLTYRTLVVLSAIGADPGASNRRIADAAGVHDQGQISKLLTRLQRLGLIGNTGAGQSRGEPNAWALTTRGREVQRAIGT